MLICKYFEVYLSCNFILKIKEVAGDHQMAEQYNTYKAVLEENNELKKNYGITKLNLDHSKITYNFKENEVAKLRSEIK